MLAVIVLANTASAQVKIMPLGDSITKGWHGSLYADGYRKPLYTHLTTAGYYFDFAGSQADGNFPDPNHEGHSGWQADTDGTDDILGQVYNWLTVNPADIVLLHIGTNDVSYYGEDANEVSDILDEIDRFSTDIKVVLALIINRNPYCPRTAQYNIDLNNMAQSRIAAGDDITIVDMESALDYDTDLIDTVHPNDDGYAKMAGVWFAALDDILTPPAITSMPVTDADIFRPYSYDVNTSGYPEPTYTLITAPNSMTIDHNTGLIEWSPASAGSFNVTVQASNGHIPDANQSFVITVKDGIEFDSASSNSDGTAGDTLSWQHTIADGNNRILVVGIAGEDDNASDLIISNITYNGVNMILVEDSNELVSSGSPAYSMKTELYYLLDADLPSIPGDYTVTVTYNGSVAERCGSAVSLLNAAQQSAHAVATNSNVGPNSISTDITTQNDYAWLIDIVGCGNSGLFSTADSNMTERFDINTDSSTAAGGTKTVPAAKTATMSWTFSDNANRLAHSVAAFIPAPHIIAGYISEPNNAPIEGILVVTDANESSDVTDANGYYELSVPYSWSGTAMPMKDGALFNPSQRIYSNLVIDLPGQNYQDLSIYDLDTNGFIDWGDVKIIGQNWLITDPNAEGDFYDDDIINFMDFADFATAW